MQTSASCDNDSVDNMSVAKGDQTLRQQLICKLRDLIKEDQEEKAIGSGLERAARYKRVKTASNSANAAEAARKRASMIYLIYQYYY